MWDNWKLIVLPFLSGLLAQSIKVIISCFTEHRVNFRRFVEMGGMPSSHTAAASALSTLVWLKEGYESTIFAVTLFFSFIVMYEAAGLRRAAGRQAQVLNQIIEEFHRSGKIERIKLRELLGHTPLEVFMGGVLGFFFGLAFY
ncbi:divergent PAP2 family protein [bacterium]|nr:MAG: divergent PAP2 family protein [bacterium]